MTQSMCRECFLNLNLLSPLGFVINKSKSIFILTKVCRILSFIFHTIFFLVSIPADKRNNLLQLTSIFFNLNFLLDSFCKFYWFPYFCLSSCTIWLYNILVLHTKILKTEKFLGFSAAGDNFNARILLPSLIKKDFMENCGN